MGNEEEVLCYYKKKLGQELDPEKLLLIFRKLEIVRVNPTHLKKTGIMELLRPLRLNSGKVGEAAQHLVKKWRDIENGAASRSSSSSNASSHRESSASANGHHERNARAGGGGSEPSARSVTAKAEPAPVRIKIEPERVKIEPVRAKVEPVRAKVEPVRVKVEPVSVKSEPLDDLGLSDGYDWSPPPPVPHETHANDRFDAGAVRVKIEKDHGGSWDEAIGGNDNNGSSPSSSSDARRSRGRQEAAKGVSSEKKHSSDRNRHKSEAKKKDRSSGGGGGGSGGGGVDSRHHGAKKPESKTKDRSRESGNGEAAVTVKKEKDDRVHHHHHRHHKSDKRSHASAAAPPPLPPPVSASAGTKDKPPTVKSEHCRSDEKKSSHGERRSKTEESSSSKEKSSRSSSSRPSARSPAAIAAVATADGSGVSPSSSSSSSRKTSKKSTKRASEDGFNATMASFEDCLGLNDVSSRPAAKKRKVNTTPPPSTSSATKSSSTSSKKRATSAATAPSVKLKLLAPMKMELGDDDGGGDSPSSSSPPVLNLPEILTRSVGEPPSHASIFSTLPEIQPNYKPLRYNILDTLPKKSREMQIDSTSFGRSTERTAVFSGRRTAQTVASLTSLRDCCVKVLKENTYVMQRVFTLNLEFPPYELLKPALERCSPALLESIENLNDYLLDDSDELWQLHCNREFKGHEPDDTETWRELYSKLGLEREVKFKRVTAIISQAQAKKVPERKAIMAFVDGSAKPPRNVARQQARFGTAGPPPRDDRSRMSATAKANLSKIGKTGAAVANATSTSGITVCVPAEAGPSGHGRRGGGGGGGVEGGSDQKAGKKVAPLMQKTLKFMKNRFRR